MISYEPFYKTLREKKITSYKLIPIQQFGIAGRGLIQHFGHL